MNSGRLVAFAPGVVVEARRETEFLTRAAAHLLSAGPDAVLTSHSALAAYGCTTADTAPIHIRVPYHRQLRRRFGLVAHQGAYDAQDVEEIVGLRVLALDLALAEVLCRSPRRIALACADETLRLTTEVARAELHAWVEERVRARPDPRGRKQALQLLNLATGRSESPMESWMLLAAVDGGLPIPEQQFQVTDLAGNEVYRLDFAWPEVRVALEYDGYEAHEGRRELDAARDADLQRRGWIVIRADKTDLADPSRVIRAVEDAFRRRGLAA